MCFLFILPFILLNWGQIILWWSLVYGSSAEEGWCNRFKSSRVEIPVNKRSLACNAVCVSWWGPRTGVFHSWAEIQPRNVGDIAWLIAGAYGGESCSTVSKSRRQYGKCNWRSCSTRLSAWGRLCRDWFLTGASAILSVTDAEAGLDGGGDHPQAIIEMFKVKAKECHSTFRSGQCCCRGKAQMVALSLLPVLRGRFAEVSKVSEIQYILDPRPKLHTLGSLSRDNMLYCSIYR